MKKKFSMQFWTAFSWNYGSFSVIWKAENIPELAGRLVKLQQSEGMVFPDVFANPDLNN